MNSNFEIALTTYDFSQERIQQTFDELCALAAYTKLPPALALSSIVDRLLDLKLGLHEYHLEQGLMRAYKCIAKAEKSYAASRGDIQKKATVNLSAITAHAFLKAVYGTDQRVAVFDNEAPICVWTANSSENSISIAGENSIRYWPMPCVESGPGSRTSVSVESWTYAVVSADDLGAMDELFKRDIPIVAIISNRRNHYCALVRVNATNRKTWMEKRERLTTVLNDPEIKISRHEHLIGLPGTVGRDRITRLHYFNPDAPAVE